jgi:DNA-binding NarL/FixJ family response regulator
MIKIALADDHKLLRQSLATMIGSFGPFEVIWQASNGKEAIKSLKEQEPDILLLDIRMPLMDGFDTCSYITSNHPSVKVLVLSMMEDEMAIIRMLRSGARGYMLKDMEAAELKLALITLHQSGYYLNDLVTGKMVHTILNKEDEQPIVNVSLTEKELEFLVYASTEMTYKEIAEIMHLSPRTIDGYRDGLFAKLHIRSRVGLAMYAVRKGIVVPKPLP